MSTLAQLSAGQEVDSTMELALKFIPIIELHANISNFNEWEHSIRFYLDYHGLYSYIDPNFEIRCTSGPIHHHRLFHNPKLLLEALHDYRSFYVLLATGSKVEVLEVYEDWR
ncbi:hypothetical protein NEUTE2DRAFT_106234 [Neurospora tetrasperma FGSC 2509]|nr:hypothetical protein NEUTE2DRAFT_106234 [Neurospora tetrasperma FGSC 2509]